MGVVLVSENKYKEAEDMFRKSYELNPSNSRGLMGLSEVIMAQKQPDRAMQVLRAEIEKFPTRIEFRLALADLEAEMSRLLPAVVRLTTELHAAVK
jgi:predicted Zn-dependent protease